MPQAKGSGGPLSMADRDGSIWYDGKLVEWRSATTHVLTHSLHYGLAVFEGVRAYQTAIGTAIFRLKEHTDRLFNSAHIYMMKLPFTREQLMEAQLEVVRANQHDACYIRPIAFYGITRSSVIELAQGLGYEVGAKRLTRDDIYIADECFFTGTAAEVTPIRELDGRTIGAGQAGPVTQAIQKAFFDVVNGKDDKHRHWLTPVAAKKR